MRLTATETRLTKTYDTGRVDRKNNIFELDFPKKEQLREFNDKVNEPDTILSDNEKQFFKKIFPESKESLDRHVVFNRNGRVQSKSFSLGTLLDAKV